MQNGDQKVGEVSGFVIHLQPTDHAMVSQILGDARFGNPQVLGKLRLDGFAAAPC